MGGGGGSVSPHSSPSIFLSLSAWGDLAHLLPPFPLLSLMSCPSLSPLALWCPEPGKTAYYGGCHVNRAAVTSWSHPKYTHMYKWTHAIDASNARTHQHTTHTDFSSSRWLILYSLTHGWVVCVEANKAFVVLGWTQQEAGVSSVVDTGNVWNNNDCLNLTWPEMKHWSLFTI